ncbi:MAG: hypothetical protein PHD72_03430 [Patescibacteria group bacterium]|nr:hypothetical protein [Patescibacteria group bacterium]
MKLLIDNSLEDQVVFCLSISDGWKKFVFSQTVRPKPLLVFLEALLSKQKKHLTDLSGVAVVIGRGRFTATRIAVTVANTLAYALAIPVVGVTEADFKLVDKKLKQAKIGVYISAKYSGEANIGGTSPKV